MVFSSARTMVFLATPGSSSQNDQNQPIIVQAPPKVCSLASIAKDMVLEKFGSHHINASSWLDMFESECTCVKLDDDKRWQVVRLFMEGPAMD